MNGTTITIPGVLFQWAERDTLAAAYAQELLALGARAGDEVQIETPEAWQRAWCCVEAVVYGAVAAERADLLVGLPVWLAEALGLRFAWTSADGRSFALGGDGRGPSTSWAGVAALCGWSARNPDRDVAIRLAIEVLDAKPMRLVEDRPCSKCGRVSCVSVDTIDDVRYCGGCWSLLTAPATVSVPRAIAPKRKPTRRR